MLSQLEQCTKIPDFNNYLAYIFADGDNLAIEVSYFFESHLPSISILAIGRRSRNVAIRYMQVRQSAGLLLKNNLKYHYAGATEELRQYIKVKLIQ